MLDNVAGGDHVLGIMVGDLALAHALFGVGGDEVSVLGNGFSQRCDVEHGHGTGALALGRAGVA
jgi:hypothetical protein